MKTFLGVRHLAVIGAVILVACGCGRKPKAGFAPRPAMVKLAPAIQRDTPVLVEAYGTLQEQQNVDVVPQVSGILETALVQDGAMVTNGQPLFQIDPRDYQVRVEQAEALVAAGRANLDQARANLERNRELLDKKLVPPDTFDAIKARVAALESQLRLDEAGLKQARLNLSRCLIVAPLDGVCSKRFVDAGNLVTAGASRLLNIRRNNPLRLECSVSEQYLGALRDAMAKAPVPVTVIPRGDTNRYEGVVSFVDNAVNPATGTILLRGEIPNPSLKLWANQFVTVRITLATTAAAILVPESAVQFGKQGPYVYVVGADYKATLRPVTTGVRQDNLIQIAEGVKAGESVVTMGQLKVYPGATVTDSAQTQTGQGEKH